MNPKWEGMTDDLIPQATAWRNALVDGSHHQGRDGLRLNDGGMCCLGVLCDTLDPSRWTTFQGIWYWGPDDVFPPSETMKQFGLTETGTRMDGEFWTINGTEFSSLSFANDRDGITHAHIADALTEYFGLDPYVAAEDQ